MLHLPSSFLFIQCLTSLRALIEEEGLAEMVHPRDFSFQLLPLDTDLFTLDMPEFFRSAFVRADLSLLSTVAKSIFGVETCFGRDHMTFMHDVFSRFSVTFQSWGI